MAVIARSDWSAATDDGHHSLLSVFSKRPDHSKFVPFPYSLICDPALEKTKTKTVYTVVFSVHWPATISFVLLFDGRPNDRKYVLRTPPCDSSLYFLLFHGQD